MSQIVTVHFDKEAMKEFHAISPDQHSDEQWAPDGTYSAPFVWNRTAYYYIFKAENGRGELWGLDIDLNKWHKCFEQDAHVILNATIIFTSNGRLFLHGQCSNENCSEEAHVYHFGVSFCGKMIFPTIDQLGVLFSKKKTQFVHGKKNSGKTFVLLLKAIKAFKATSNGSAIKIFVSTNEQRNFVQEHLASSGVFFNSNDILLFTETDVAHEKYADCEIFVDGLSSFSFEQKQFFLKRNAKSIITFDEQVSFQSGYEQPRSNDISWHQLSHPSKLIDRLCSSFQTKVKICSTTSFKIETPKNLMEHFIHQSMEAMDQFYDGWWSQSFEKQTICIPACHDVFKHRYFGPTDSNAKNFDDKIFKDEEYLWRGQKAELDLLTLFQKCQIGGVFVSGFNSREFVKNPKCHKKFANAGVREFEIDGIFMHPLLGIFVFEVKATEQSNYLKTKEKAEKQLEKIKEQLPIIIQNICNAKSTIPIYFSICFPNANIPDNEKKKSFFYFDKSSFSDETELKLILLKNFRPQDELISTSMKIFTATVAGYRSMDFLSAGYNALAVHKLIDKQIFMKSFVKNVQGGDGIFLTNEQLAVIDCSDQHQIISGPPGTGKTLLLLRKALASARTEKEGNVHVVTRRKELIFKFQKFFEQHRNGIVRLPVLHSGYKDISLYLDNEDIFADEFELSQIPLLQQRLKQDGQTVIVITGMNEPLAVNNIVNILNEHNLTGYRHFSMNTVIRSSKEIFDEWKNEYISNNYPLHLGHNINGPKVTRIKLNNTNEILEKILETIRDLFLTHEDAEQAAKISLSNLCIITDDDNSCSLIKSFLACHRVPCGSVEEQIDNQHNVVVAVSDATVSHEWPVVIIVAMGDIAYRDTFFLLASSRCIAKLIVIERDFLGTMEKIDELTQPMIRGSLSKVTFIELFEATSMVAGKNGETELFVKCHDIISQVLRWNIFFSELKNLREFENCQSLCDCWQIIADQPILCRAVLNDNKSLRMDLERIKIGTLLLPNKPTRSLARITSVHSTTEYQVKIWEIYKRLVHALLESMRQENSGIRPNENETQEEGRIVEQLNMAGFSWEFLKTAIIYLL